MSFLKGYQQSLAQRLSIRLFFMLLLALAPIGWLVGHLIDRVATSQTKHVCMSILEAMKQRTRRQISDVDVAVMNHVDQMEAQLDHPNQIETLLTRFVETNPQILGCGIAYEPYYFKEKGKWQEIYATCDSVGNINVRQIGSPSHDYLKAQWYLEAKKTVNGGFWSDAYYDKIGGRQAMITYSVPIHDAEGNVKAVFAADMSLDELSNFLEKMDSTNADSYAKHGLKNFRKYGSHSFILDDKGTFITHMDKSQILKRNFYKLATESADTTLDRIKDDMINDRKGYAQLDVSGKHLHVFYMPVKHAHWTILTVVPDEYVHYAARQIGFILGVLMLLASVLINLVCMGIVRRMIRPLKRLSTSANEVANGNFKASLPTLKHHDEVHDLRDSFEHMQHSLTKYMADLEETTASKAAIENELKIANNIQMSMVPSKYPPYPERSDIDIFGHMTPAKSVGGDLFDFHIRDEKLFFCIGDVSGKGVPAALLMTVTKKLFHSLTMHEDSPEVIMKKLNGAINDDNKMFMFVTVFIGVLDLETGHLSYCNGGHDAPLLIGEGILQLPVKPNFPVGLRPRVKFEAQEADIKPNTTIFLYTDGLTEAKDADKQLYGKERLMKLADNLLVKDQIPKRLIEKTLESVTTFVGEAEQSDDLTLLAIRYFGKQS